MGNMACETVFHRRRMLPKIRPSGFGVTLKAFQIDVLGIDQLIGDGPVGVMAIRALTSPETYFVTTRFLMQRLRTTPFLTLAPMAHRPGTFMEMSLTILSQHLKSVRTASLEAIHRT